MKFGGVQPVLGSSSLQQHRLGGCKIEHRSPCNVNEQATTDLNLKGSPLFVVVATPTRYVLFCPLSQQHKPPTISCMLTRSADRLRIITTQRYVCTYSIQYVQGRVQYSTIRKYRGGAVAQKLGLDVFPTPTTTLPSLPRSAPNITIGAYTPGS